MKNTLNVKLKPPVGGSKLLLKCPYYCFMSDLNKFTCMQAQKHFSLLKNII